MSPKSASRVALDIEEPWGPKGTLYTSLGGTKTYCEICGGRVTTPFCIRHERPDGEYVTLRDKYAQLRFIRRILK